MGTESKDAEQNALAARLGRVWTNFKEGKLISYKMMAFLLIVVAVLGTWIYISSESRQATSQMGLEFDAANTATKLEEFIKQQQERDKDSLLARYAQLQLACANLGRQGLSQLNDLNTLPDIQQKAVEEVEKGRDTFAKLLETSKDDPVMKGICHWALAMAETGLVGVPKDLSAPTGLGPVAPSTETRGQVDTVLKHLNDLVALQDANPGIEIPWAKDAKERAESIQKDPEKFRTTAIHLFQYKSPTAKTDPLAPIAPKKN